MDSLVKVCTSSAITVPLAGTAEQVLNAESRGAGVAADRDLVGRVQRRDGDVAVGGIDGGGDVGEAARAVCSCARVAT